MGKLTSLHFYPERIAWWGLAVLGLGVCVCLLVQSKGEGSYSFSAKERRPKELPTSPITFSLGLQETGPVLPLPELQGEMTFSFDPPRPGMGIEGKRLLVRCKRSGESKRVVLPCRLDLEFRGDRLGFAKEASIFWVDLSLNPGGLIEGKSWIQSEGKRISAGKFSMMAQEAPLRSAQEFAEGSPFRILAEARWWGRDQFLDAKEARERIEMGSEELVEFQEGEWLVWKGGKWEKASHPEAGFAVAHIQSSSSKGLVLEGWDEEGHVRVQLNPAVGPPFKIRAEELISSIRIRSEKQISCMVEKQCMVLKTGDWVLKSGGRWKILRKKEERDAYANGKLCGELFVFEQISQRQGQKMIQGRLFNPGRTQVIPVELSAHSGRLKGSRKGKSP